MFCNEKYFFSHTDDISISACPVLVDDNENDSKSVWAYYFCFENNSNKKMQLVGKNWNITDGLGNSFYDSSIGFKGEIPELEPGEYFEFTSEIPLSSEAVFYGSCQISLDNKLVEVKMPTFYLGEDKKEIRVIN